MAPDDAGRPVAPLVRGTDWLDWKETVVEGRPAFYGEAGSGPPALFLHGWGLDHKAYKRALSRLVRAGLHVYAPALPGFGGTAGLEPRPPGCPPTATGWRHSSTPSGWGHRSSLGAFVRRRRRRHAGPDHPITSVPVLINSVGGSAWAHSGSTVRSMAERPLWDWGIHFPADLLPIRQARRVLPVILAEGLPNLLRNHGRFWRRAGLARRADLTVELDVLRQRRLPVVVLWGQHDHLVTRASFEDMCRSLR